MAEEQGAFAFGDVVEAVTTKMIRRHPHVFGSEAERAAGVTSGFWERAKAAEKAGTERRGVLDDVPVTLPALTRAIKLQNKAAKVGFDWPSLAPVFDKLDEEIAELQDEIARTAARPPQPRSCHRGGIRRPAVRRRQRRAPPQARPRGRPARRQRQVRAPLPLHRGAARRAGAHAGAVGPRRDGRPVGRGEGRRALRLPLPGPRKALRCNKI